MDIKQALGKVIDGGDLSAAGMGAVMKQIMTGEATAAQIGAFLAALRMKGESIDEITAAAEVMRALAARVTVDAQQLTDVVGTGGDGLRTFNISTAAMFIAAAAGGRMAKHGNRAASGASGSADVLAAAGVPLDLPPADVAKCIEQTGIGFMFAPQHHSAMKHAIGPRREMGVRTIFNVLGPLTNPAGAENFLLGVFSAALTGPLARVLQKLGARRAMVVCADDGMDEISTAAPTRVAELRDGEIREYQITPEDFGLARSTVDSLTVNDAEQSLQIINQVFAGGQGAARDILLLNGGAAVYVAGRAATLTAGITCAAEVVDSGAAAGKMGEFVAFARGLGAGK
ncbi:MAG: anthranilate phosphoribosyltransferase [Gammaproteobacteria bacterium]|nr:anthranilate phosphoribosyltransferase [Gammaproteobacteria bacterium]MDD9870517.1 anthranilate phosphoribosyltransferase [Gammaproteobacteria bacterium]